MLERDSTEAPPSDHLVFNGGAGHFAVPAERAQEVLTFVRLTPVPGAPPHVLGLLPHRGEILPVVDWSLLAGGGPENTQRAVVVRDPKGAFALTLRDVVGIAVLEGEAASAGPDGLAGCLRTGMRLADQPVTLIDPAGLFDFLSLARHK